MGRPTWTDDELRDAVASQRSWRGVLRALGLRDSSGGSIGTVRRRADQLGLDYTHFSGNRKWTDDRLIEAVQSSGSWPEVAERLGLVRERRTGLRLKGDARRLRLDVTHLDGSQPSRDLIDLVELGPDPTNLRHAATLIAAAWFASRGLPVALPSEPQRYDLLVTTSTSVDRVQVKSTTNATPSGTWHVGIGRRPYSMERDSGTEPYDPDDIDLFAVINGVGELYLIPIEAVAGRTGIYLSAYQEYKAGDVSSLLN